jgi:hypothetical protein
VATDFILNAPFGELKEVRARPAARFALRHCVSHTTWCADQVIADVQVLIGGEAVLADKLPGIVRQYNHSRRVAAEGQVTVSCGQLPAGSISSERPL